TERGPADEERERLVLVRGPRLQAGNEERGEPDGARGDPDREPALGPGPPGNGRRVGRLRGRLPRRFEPRSLPRWSGWRRGQSGRAPRLAAGPESSSFQGAVCAADTQERGHCPRSVCND